MRRAEVAVYEFSDYRAFLVAHCQAMKRRNPLWSLGVWSRSLGLKATSSLTKVIHGERSPGAKILAGLVKYFEFDREEERHFRDLIRLNRLKSDPELSALLLKEISSRHAGGNFARIDEAMFSALSEWYCYTIREMVNLDTFLEDPNWISSQLCHPVSPAEVKRALERLLSTGLLRRNAQGELELGAPRIDTSNDVASQAIRNYHAQSLENAKGALETVAPALREITSTTFAFDPERLPEAKQMIRKFRSQFAKAFETKNASAVYQFNLNFFPQTKVDESNFGGASNATH